MLAVLFVGCARSPEPPPRPYRIGARPAVRSHTLPQGHVATEGATRALVVFVRFRDDLTAGDPCLDARGWPYPLASGTLPTFATTLLASSPEPPFPDSTLTEYFYEQSNGRFVLYGDVYPREYVSRRPAAAYARAAEGGYGYLTQELLEDLDPEVDFRRYDTNPRDGRVDQLFVVVRADPRATFTGVANLDGADAVRGRPRTTLTFDGVSFDWTQSGSYFIHRRPGNIIPQHYYVRLMAHEFGHHLWSSRGFFRGGHVQAIRTNDVPANGTDRLGYVLMAGRGGGRDMRGDELISAYERDLLGWLDPIALSPTQTDTTLLLRDGYLSGDVLRFPLSDDDPATPDPIVYVENRQPLGAFDRPRIQAKPGCPTFAFRQVRDDGLLVTLATPNLDAVDVLPADNTLTLSNDDVDYQGDLFGPPDAVQLSPWTSPALARPDGRPSWIALDEIRYGGDADGTLQVRLVRDIRADPVIRSPSVMEAGMDGFVFERPIVVGGAQSLTLRDASLTAPALHLGEGARLTIESGAELTITSDLRVAAGAEVDLAGRLVLPGAPTLIPPDERGPVRLRAGSTLEVGDRIIRSPSDRRWPID